MRPLLEICLPAKYKNISLMLKPAGGGLAITELMVAALRDGDHPRALFDGRSFITACWIQ
jgi:hypothetical protein